MTFEFRNAMVALEEKGLCVLEIIVDLKFSINLF